MKRAIDTTHYDKLIKGWKEGKIIQKHTVDGWIDRNMDVFNPNEWFLKDLNDPNQLRVKPEVVVKEVPLSIDDLPMPSIVRFHDSAAEHLVLSKTKQGVYLCSYGSTFLHTWEELKSRKAEYKYGNCDWRYFKKTITTTVE